MTRKTLYSLGLAAIAVGILVLAGGDAEAARTAIASWDHEAAYGFAAAGLIINRQTLATTFVGFKTIFNDAFATAESDYAKVAMEVTSTTAAEDYKWMGKTTRFREWIGDRVVQNLSAHSYIIQNKPFENTVGVDRDDIEDDKLGVYTPLMQQLGYDAKTHPDELVFPLLAAGFTQTCFDGQYFFDTDHPVRAENGATVSVSNMQPGASTPWFLLDTSKPIRPLIFQKRRPYSFVAMDAPNDEAVFSRKEYRYGADGRGNAGYALWQMAFGSKAALNEENLAAAIASMRSIKGDQGRPLNIKPTLLVVPPSLEHAAKKLVKAETVNGTTNVLRDCAEILSTSWLA